MLRWHLEVVSPALTFVSCQIDRPVDMEGRMLLREDSRVRPHCKP